MILSSDKSSERNLSCFFDMIKPRRIEYLHKEEPFSSDPYSRDTFLLNFYIMTLPSGYVGQKVLRDICLEAQLNEEECDDYVGMVFR